MSGDTLMQPLVLSLLKNTFAILKLAPDARIPEWALSNTSDFLSVTRTSEELSIVSEQSHVPASVETIVRDWRAFKVDEQLDFSLTGILSSLLEPMAANK